MNNTNNLSTTTSVNSILNELKDQEWRTFTIDNSVNGNSTCLFIKSLFTIDTYSIIISDLSLVWIKHSDSTTTINDKNRFNPHLDSPIEKILQTILKDSVNEKKSDTAYRLTINNSNNLIFTMSTKISFYTFKWSFECDPIETIINLDSRKSHSDFIKDHLIIPLMFVCKNQQQTNQLLNKKVDKLVNIVNSGGGNGGNNNNGSGGINVNNSGVATLSVNVGSGGTTRNKTTSISNLNSKKPGSNQINSILSESIKQEDFLQNDFNPIFNDPIFVQYYNFINESKQQQQDNQTDLNNTTILDIDNSTNKNHSTTSTTTTTSSTTGELSLAYDCESTPKKNYNNNRFKTNSTINSLPSSLSFIPFSNSQNSSLSFQNSLENFDDNDYTINENSNNNTNISKDSTSGNLKLQFEQSEQELIEEKKRKLDLEEKLEQSKQKQLNKKKKTKFV